MQAGVVYPQVELGGDAGVTMGANPTTVNGHIVLLSDWEDSLRFEAFIDRCRAGCRACTPRQNWGDRRLSRLGGLLDQLVLKRARGFS